MVKEISSTHSFWTASTVVPDWRTCIQITPLATCSYLIFFSFSYFTSELPWGRATAGGQRCVFWIEGVGRHVNAVACFVVGLTRGPVDFFTQERPVHRTPAIIVWTFDVGTRCPVRAHCVWVICLRAISFCITAGDFWLEYIEPLDNFVRHFRFASVFRATRRVPRAQHMSLAW